MIMSCLFNQECIVSSHVYALFAEGTVSIQVLDSDDNPPSFSAATYPANISENSPAGTPIQFLTPIIVIDLDKVGHDSVYITLY